MIVGDGALGGVGVTGGDDVQVPAGTVAGAVYTPPWVTEPHAEGSWIDQTTATSEVPETVAVKVAVPPAGTVPWVERRTPVSPASPTR